MNTVTPLPEASFINANYAAVCDLTPPKGFSRGAWFYCKTFHYIYSGKFLQELYEDRDEALDDIVKNHPIGSQYEDLFAHYCLTVMAGNMSPDARYACDAYDFTDAGFAGVKHELEGMREELLVNELREVMLTGRARATPLRLYGILDGLEVLLVAVHERDYPLVGSATATLHHRFAPSNNVTFYRGFLGKINERS